MTGTVVLPRSDGSLHRLTLRDPAVVPESGPAPVSRRAYAAVHVVADPLRADASGAAAIDWAATVDARRRMWRTGLGVAEAMDTAQRGMGLSWDAVRELISVSLEAARADGGDVVVGVATDQLSPGDAPSLAAVRSAYLEQLDLVQGLGGRAVLMASRHLAVAARSPRDYLDTYGAVIEAADRPVVLHWLGEAFDPALAGYWGSADLDAAECTVLELIERHGDRIDGIKLSLLDAEREVRLRRRLPTGVRLYTGDDFNYVRLIEGDEAGHSDALLGAFAALAPFAAEALRRLDASDADGYRELLGPTEALSRTVFQTPTYFYKTGIVWLAYLCGHQDHFRMVGGLESGRSLLHLAEVAERADAIGLFPDPELAAARITALMRLHGIG